MRSLKSLVASAKLYVVVVSGVAICSGGLAYAESDGSMVQLMVCPQANESFLTITEPKSDSVTGSPHITIGGAVRYISQIDFYIDERYDSTKALGFEDTTYRETLTLEPGTRTVKAVAYDTCHETTHTQSIIVTLEPAVGTQRPQQGAEDSSLPGSGLSGGTVGQTPPAAELELPGWFNVVRQHLASDLGLTVQKNTWGIRDFVDAFLIVVALTILLFPRKFARHGLKTYVAVRQKIFAATTYAKRRHKRALPQHAVGWTRFFGVMLILVVFL